MEKITVCVFHKAGILEPDGKFNSDAAIILLSLLGVEWNTAAELIQKCNNSIAGLDAEDTAYAIFRCLDSGVRSKKYAQGSFHTFTLIDTRGTI